jgi:hypothetical protein
VPYEFSVEEQEDYIRVQVSGARIQGSEVEDAISVWSRVARICDEKKENLVLGIFEVTGRLPTPAAHAIAYDPQRFGWSRRLRLALVVVDEEVRQDALFVEDVAVSGGYQVRIFDNEDKAKVWLREK